MTARWGIALFVGGPVVVLGAAMLFAGRSMDGFDLPAPDERVVAVVSSPDGTRGASVVEIAEIAPKVEGVLVRVGGEEAFSAFGVEAVRVRWLDAGTIEVSFRHARSTRMGKVKGLRVVVKGKVDP